MEAAIQCGLVNDISSINSSCLSNISNKFLELFTPEGILKCVLYYINLKETVISVIFAARKIPISIKTKLKDEIDSMIKKTISEPVSVSTDWINTIAVVVKLHGELRVCMDRRQLNKYIERKHYSLPTVETALSELYGTQYFSVHFLTMVFQLKL